MLFPFRAIPVIIHCYFLLELSQLPYTVISFQSYPSYHSQWANYPPPSYSSGYNYYWASICILHHVIIIVTIIAICCKHRYILALALGLSQTCDLLTQAPDFIEKCRSCVAIAMNGCVSEWVEMGFLNGCVAWMLQGRRVACTWLSSELFALHWKTPTWPNWSLHDFCLGSFKREVSF